MMNNESNLVAVSREDVASVALVDTLKNPMGQFYCSIEDDGSRESKVKIFNAVNSADSNIADHIGEVLEIVDVVAHPVELADEETGEIIQALRAVLIDVNGISYAAVSQGITSALSKVFSIVGPPSWKEHPVKMKLKQVKTRNGNNKVNTIELV